MLAPVGLIGLGLLGAALAQRLARASHRIVGFDIDPAARERFAADGHAALASATAVASAAERVVLCLPNSDIASTVIDEISRELTPGRILIDTTTADPDTTAALGAKLAARGVAYLDATIAASSQQVRDGQAVLLVGGERAAAERCGDVFDAVGRRWHYLGPCGAGARMKLVNNLVMGLNRAALAEGLAFAERIGVDPRKALDVMKDSNAYSVVMDLKGEKMLANDDAPQAHLAQHLKDVRLMLGMAERSGGYVPLSETHAALLAEMVHRGQGEADNSAIIQLFRRPPARTNEA